MIREGNERRFAIDNVLVAPFFDVSYFTVCVASKGNSGKYLYPLLLYTVTLVFAATAVLSFPILRRIF